MSREGRHGLLAGEALAPACAPGARTELGRATRYCVVGASNTVLTFVAFAALTSFGCPASISSAVGFVLGAANGWIWNTRWTFAGHRGGAATAPRYVAVQVGCAGLSAVGIVLVRSHGWGRLSAEIVIIPVVTLVAYALSRLVVFKPAA